MNLTSATPFQSTGCVGEDQTDYVTYRGMWTGTQVEGIPGEADYPLGGTLTVSGIVWTINSSNGRGVLAGRIALSNSTANATEYVVRLTLVTQGRPIAGVVVPGRGFIVATFTPPDETVAPGDDRLIADENQRGILCCKRCVR